MSKVFELADGIRITIGPATGWVIAQNQMIHSRLAPLVEGVDYLEKQLLFYASCAAQTTACEGMDWQPPGLFATVEDLKANFEAWLAAIPGSDAPAFFASVGKWLDAINGVNATTNDADLQPGVDLNDPKGSKPDSTGKPKSGKTSSA